MNPIVILFVSVCSILCFETTRVVIADTFSHGISRFAFLPYRVVSGRGQILSQQLNIVSTLRGGGDDDDEAEEADDDDDDDDDDGDDNQVDDTTSTSATAKKDDDELDVKDDDEDDTAESETLDVELKETGDDVKFDAALAAAALKSASKTKVKIAQQKTAISKKTVESKLTTKVTSPVKSNSSSKNKKSIFKLIRVPYIVRASLNPFTFIAMTRSYWASLFNLNYLQQQIQSVSGQDLRSALEEKAKRSPILPNKNNGSSKRKRSMKRGQAKTLSDLPQLSS